ncbi:cellobiose phosphorylase [Candidatus Omnitrophota bacterium]
MSKGHIRGSVKYSIEENGEFSISNFNSSKPFASFFPGIAGRYGIPIWVFYVNRGQGVSAFGSKDKEHSILEFFPANKAWRFTHLLGFRTFIRTSKGSKQLFYEPFHNGFSNAGFHLSNNISITPYDLKLKETNRTLGLEVEVEYFTIPNDSYGALARTLSVRNSSKKKISLQLIDGLPRIVPYGTANLFLKKLGRTIEAWMGVKNLENGVPFYKIDVDPVDRAQVIHIKGGNFYLPFHYNGKRPKVLKAVVDPKYIFGPSNDLSCPHEFISCRNFTLPKTQITRSQMPCGFAFLKVTLAPGESKDIHSLIGSMHSPAALNSSLNRITGRGYLDKKRRENRDLILKLQSDIDTGSSSSRFNHYAKQTYLDNIMRGGYPVILGNEKRKNVFYMYSRKHGDLERDYNKFHIQSSYFSQGDGNYRDLNQNRRCDVWFNPEVGDENLITLCNLLQSDGYNPLVVKVARFSARSRSSLKKKLGRLAPARSIKKILSFLDGPFTPGELAFFLKNHRVRLNVPIDEFLQTLLADCAKHQEAEHREGFWTDHWTYNLDLLENYLSIYPEKKSEIIFNKKVFTFFDSAQTVNPRKHKYQVLEGKLRQLSSVSLHQAKSTIIGKRTTFANTSRTRHGKGKIYKTTLINKLLCLIGNKLATLDPFGVGIEMEAGKPNWYDALNGLPALFGSSLNETFELKRLIIFVRESLRSCGIKRLKITLEACQLLDALYRLIGENLESNRPERDFRYWDRSASVKEAYRAKTILGFSGKEKRVTSARIDSILELALKKLEAGIKKAKDRKTGVYCAYFINEITRSAPLKSPYINAKAFRQKRLPLFLEGQVHALRLAENKKSALALHRATRKSALFDRNLKMYKVTTSLKGMPQEIGRCRAFTPGWLENESIWMHMEYKYLLELLRGGLNEEFYKDFKNLLPPFQDPKIYGRSTLENTSFIVSSAHTDRSLWGNGFTARLSGSTAEFINIWLLMNVGARPFWIDSKARLSLRFKPILARWLFAKDNTYSFNFLSKIRIVYHNPKRKDTFGRDAVKVKRIAFRDNSGRQVEISSDTLPSPYAQQFRARQIKHADIFLG